nr:hypothetical protein [Asticcacaulis excentricus]
MLQPNVKFPDMKALADYVHSKRLERNDFRWKRHFALYFCFVAMLLRKTAHTFGFAELRFRTSL